MDSKIGVAIIIGITIGTTSLIWKSESFTYSQKVFLTMCFIFPPAQWILAILIYFFNDLKISSNIELPTLIKKTKINKTQTKDLVSALDNLYRKGLLDINEYEKKRSQLNEEVTSEQITSTNEYKQLVELRNSGILNDENFTNKVTRLKEFYGFFGHTNFSNFNWKLYQIIHKGEKLNSIEISTDDLKGLWVFDGGYFILYNNFSFRINWSDGNVKFGKWSFDSKFKFLNIKLNFFLEKKLIRLEIFEFNSKYMRYSTNYLKYKTRSKDYYAFKESNFNIEP